MSEDEMGEVIRNCKWATICTVCEDGSPYAIEATPFHMDGCHCFMINPRGGTWKNLRHNKRVLLKYTLASEDLGTWAGVSCQGVGEFVTGEEEMREGWRLLGEVMGADYSKAADTFARCKDRSPFFRVRVQDITGRCSAAKDGPFDLGHRTAGITLNAPERGAKATTSTGKG